MTPAQALLRAVLRGDALCKSAPWVELFDATPASLRPYVAHRLEQLAASPWLPVADRDRLAAARREATMDYLLRLAVLRRALVALDDAGIRTLVVKGMALAHVAYADPALRLMTDIDLWVQPGHMDAAAAALLAAGFAYPRHTHDGLRVPGTRDLGERCFEVPDHRALIEVRERSLALAAVGPERVAVMWARARTASLGGVPALVHHSHDLLLHVALHCAAHHHFAAGLGPLVDLALLVARAADEWDWPAQAAEYHALGVAPWMRLALHLSRDVARAPVPEALFTAIPEAPETGEMTRLATEQIWEPLSPLPPLLERLAGVHPPGALAPWIARRLGAYARDLPATRVWTRAREVARRILRDFGNKVRYYTRSFWNGSFRRAGLRRRAALARGRYRLAELAAAASARSTDLRRS